MFAVIAMLHNQKASRFHPIVYLPAPMPGGIDAGRCKSKMHHTQGFAERNEALAYVPTLAENVEDHLFSRVVLFLERDLEWDGEGIPVDVSVFDESTGVPFVRGSNKAVIS